MEKQILFVDDEIDLLQGLRRMLRGMRNVWSMSFASSGEEALNLMADIDIDVIVSDLQMPGMDGIELLSKIREKHPNCIRIVLSGQSNIETVMHLVGIAHQYLSKPCDTELLKSTIKRSCTLREAVSNKSIIKIIAKIDTVPSLPAVYTELIEEMQSDNSSVKKVGEIVSRDVGMTAKILKLVNSSYFGLPRHVATPTDATILLGVETITSLVLSAHAFSQFDTKKILGLSIDDVIFHSLEIGRLANRIAIKEQINKSDADHALLGGLLHDCGKLVLAANLSDDYISTLELMNSENIGFTEAEQKVFGTTHAEVGGALLGIWGLPDPVVEAVTFHHTPELAPHSEFSPLMAVHVANCLFHKKNNGNNLNENVNINLDCLTQLKMIDKIPNWQALLN
ncbi:HDOD domain-containing protein [candidate division KSB1 bacterium]|nr:HDOD domain-containing protein [candidate division KSB1 bacterium]